MTDGLPRAIAVRLQRQHDITNRRSVALERGVEALGLDREGARIVIRLAVDQQDGLIDLIGIGEGRHLRIGVAGLPVGALFGLEAERGQGPVVGPRARDAGPEQVRVRQQIGRHEGAIAVAADGNPVAVGDTHLDHSVDGRRRRGRQLFDIGVIGLRPVDADDRHGGVVQDGIALGEQEQVAGAARTYEAVGRIDHLPRHAGIGELGRIGPHQQRQGTVTILVIARRQIERARQLHPVGPFIGDQLAGDIGQLRRGVRKGRQGRAAAVRQVAQLDIGRLGEGLAAGHQAGALVVQNADKGLILTRGRAPQLGLLAGPKVHGREEGIGAFPRRPLPRHQDGRAIVRELDHGTATTIVLHHRETGIIVAILIVAIDQLAPLARVGRINDKPHLVAGVEPAGVDEGDILAAPLDASITLRQVDQGGRRTAEGCAQHQHPVSCGDLIGGITPVQRLHPDQGSVGIGPPLDRARAGRHGIERRWHIVPQRQVSDPMNRLTVQVRDHHISGEQARGHDIAVGSLGHGLQDEAPVRRQGGIQDHAGLADPLCRAVQRHQHQLAGEIVVEQGLIARAGQQVLVGADRRRASHAFLDDRAGRRTGHVGGGAAALQDGPDQKPGAVRQPVDTRAGGRIDHRGGQASRLAAFDIHDPQGQALGLIHQEGDAVPVRRPAGRGETSTLG